MTILIQIQPKSIKMSKDRINRKIRQILNALGYSHHELSVLITGNREIKELNQKYRGLDQPTKCAGISDAGG